MNPVDSNSLDKSVFVITKDTFFLNRMTQTLADFPDFKFDTFADMNTFLDLDTGSMKPFLFLIDGNLGQDPVQEWTQALKYSFPSIPLIVFHSTNTPLNFSGIKKNGADQLIHINFDREFIIDLVLEIIPYEFPNNQIPLSALSTMSSKDMDSETPVDFDVFVHLPFNKKTILFRKKGSTLEYGKIQKIEERDQHIYFKKTEKTKFLEYARKASTLNGGNNSVAETERGLKTKKLIFEIMSEFFDQEATDFKGGRVIYDRCKQIVSEYDLLRPYTPKDAFQKVLKFTGQERTFYNDAINMCVFSSLFGQALSLPMDQVESLALAGLLHNIGLSYVDNFELQNGIEKLSKEQLDTFYQYPEKSVFMIKNKKVPLPPAVSDTIIEHRENNDGTGFPNHLSSDKLKPMSRIIRVAFEFQCMTALSKLDKKRTASSALAEMKEMAISGNNTLDMNTILAIAKMSKS